MSFEYELNEFSYLTEAAYNSGTPNKSAFNRKGGGLRVKKITQSDGSTINPDIVKEYFYVNIDGLDPQAPQSSGRLVHMPSFGRRRAHWEYSIGFLTGEPTGIDKTIQDYLFAGEGSIWNIIPIIYQYVTVRDKDGGSIVYKYAILKLLYCGKLAC